MKQSFALLSLLALVACGADGEPERPEPRGPINVSITGSAEIGIAR